MMTRRFWGIFRERQHSPGRESDDAEILRLTAKHLEAAGYQVSLKTPDELGEADEPSPSLVFLMCERVAALGFLEPLAARGIPHVNPPSAVLNTYRDRMIPLLDASGVPFPESCIVSSEAFDPGHPCPVWVKRADVHNTQSGDVVFARSPAELQEAVAALHRRGIPRIVLQRHVPGDLIKFYGVGRPGGEHPQDLWFRWFYHREQELAGYPFAEEALWTVAQRAARAIGLEVYGGDAIVTPVGEVVLIDINAWPSFALYREEASEQIARWLFRRLAQGAVP
ncbi:MAG: hypothetical protein HY347_05625 [candidate division NC10 bacterium]|nr:hypothetical protein [candidate division NC10 bacterium]